MFRNLFYFDLTPKALEVVKERLGRGYVQAVGAGPHDVVPADIRALGIEPLLPLVFIDEIAQATDFYGGGGEIQNVLCGTADEVREFRNRLKAAL